MKRAPFLAIPESALLARPIPAVGWVTLAFAAPLFFYPAGAGGAVYWSIGALLLWVVALWTLGRRRGGRPVDLVLLALLVTLGAGWGSGRSVPHPPPPELPELTVRGKIESARGRLSDLKVAVDGEWKPIPGHYTLAGRAGVSGPFAGRARLTRFDEPRLPGLAERHRGSRWAGSSGIAQIENGWALEGGEAGRSLASMREGIRRRLALRIGRSLDQRIAPIIPQLVWGERLEMDPEIERWFRVTGTMHLIAISGLHVSLIALLCEFVLRVAIHRRRLRTALVLVGLGGYLLLVGAQPSVLRSVVMASAILIAKAIGRPGSITAGWWASLWILVLASPGDLTRPGAQLSFLATAALILRPSAPKLLGTLVASYAATGATSGVLLAHFGETAPSAVLVNLIGIPAFTPCLIAVLWGLAWGDPSAAWMQSIAWGPARIFLDTWFRTIGLFVPMGESTMIRISSGEAAGLLSSLIFLAICAVARRAKGMVGSMAWLAAAGIICIGVAAAPSIARALRGPIPQITLLPVGQGDAILIRTGRFTAYLIDTGPDLEDGSRGRRLACALRHYGVFRLKGLFLTHGDFDHCGALRGLLLGGMAVDSLCLSAGDDYALRAPRGRAPPLRDLTAPSAWESGALRFELIWPRPERLASQGNEASLVLRVSGPGGTVLLPGDLGREGEESLLAIGAVERTDVLMAGHHGSRGSTIDRWIDRIAPSRAVVSCGARNRFGHPHPEVLERFGRRSIPLLRTDRDGPIRILWRGDGIQVCPRS